MLIQPTSSARLRKIAQVKAQESRKPVALPAGPPTCAEDRDPQQDDGEEGGVDHLGDDRAEQGQPPGLESAPTGVAEHREEEGERRGQQQDEGDRRLGEEADRQPGQEQDRAEQADREEGQHREPGEDAVAALGGDLGLVACRRRRSSPRAPRGRGLPGEERR